MPLFTHPRVVQSLCYFLLNMKGKFLMCLQTALFHTMIVIATLGEKNTMKNSSYNLSAILHYNSFLQHWKNIPLHFCETPKMYNSLNFSAEMVMAVKNTDHFKVFSHKLTTVFFNT